MRYLAYALIALAVLSAPLRAQDEEESGGFLVDLLQDNLSGENRYIKVTGLEGALSGRATIRELTVSDDDGVWLTVTDAVLDWNRLALVRGRFSVNTLSAGEINLARNPQPTAAADDLPAPEATPFQVPELPVAVEIGELKVGKFILGEPVIGRPAELSMIGAFTLADGTLATKLEIARLDRPTDLLHLVAGFENTTSVISVDLDLVETENGLVSEILQVPDRPSIRLTAKGQGPVHDFTADIALASDDVERLAGQVRLHDVIVQGQTDETPPSIGFEADLAGDITPLLAADFQSFFGSDLRLALLGQSDPDGRLTIQKLDLASQALTLNAAVDIAGSGQIRTVLLQGRIAPPDGASVTLPLSGPRTTIQSALISARLEADKDETWDFRLGVDGLSRPDMTIARTEINVDGILNQQGTTRLNGTVQGAIGGISFADDALNRAVGPQVGLDGTFELIDETALRLGQFLVNGTDYSATFDGLIDGLNSGFLVDGRATVQATDLSRFSEIAGKDLGGKVSASVTGAGAPLNGTFDFDLNAKAQDLTTGIAQLDSLLSGATELALLAARDQGGLEIRTFRLDGTAVTAQASGAVRSDDTDLGFTARLDDLARLIPQMPGPLTLAGDVSQTGSRLSGTVRLDGPDASFANMEGSLDRDGTIDLTYDAALTGIEKFLAQFPGNLTATGSVQRADGVWNVTSSAAGPGGVTADVAGALDLPGLVSLDVDLAEPQGGPISELLRIPDRPSLRLTAEGLGPVADFAADISLASNGAERLGGRVKLGNLSTPGADASAPPSLGFRANLAGDVTPLLASEYRAFFGDDTQMTLAGRSDPDGRLVIERLDLLSNALILNGALDMAGSGIVETAAILGRIAPPSGANVVLPLPGPRTAIGSAALSARLHGENGDTWKVQLGLNDIDRPDMTLSRVELDADGTLDQTDNMHLTGAVKAMASGLALANTALNDAIGPQVELNGGFELVDKTTLTLSRFALSGTDYASSLDATITDLDSTMQIQGRAHLGLNDLARFSGLAGRPIAGMASVDLSGTGAPTAQTFDIDLTVDAQDLATGIAQLDAILPGRTGVTVLADRTGTDLTISQFHLDGAALTADASGTMGQDDVDLQLSAKLDDLARVVPEAPGPLTLTGNVTQTDGDIEGLLRVDGPTSSFVDLKGSMTPEGAINLIYKAVLGKLQRFVPEFPGDISARGTAERTGDVWTIDTTAAGPAGIEAKIAGTLNQASLESNLTAKGQVQLGAANKFIVPNSVRGTANFDLALKGAAKLDNITGTISTANTSVAIPAVRQTIDDLDADIALSNGRADLSVTAGLRAGGQVRVTGPVKLAAPFEASLVADIQQLVLTDNVTFESSANGQLTYNGALARSGAVVGEIQFGETNININAMSGSIGAAPIPPITHRNEPGAVLSTRKHAGLIETSKAGSGPEIKLNVRLAAENKVFVRGRGLQAELGGNILIRGTAAKVAPSGQIGLIRGNLDILGRRLRLSKGLVTLQGKLEPYMEFAATSNTSDGVATLEIAGPLTSPKVNVYSEPERPSEEALAMLVFGNQYSEISPLKIAQMAASLAQLSGSGGGVTDRAREGLGVDTLDVGTDDSGNAQVGAGKYLADGVYTDFSVNALGDTELNINLDVTDSLTLKGTVDNTGDTALGVFFQRDY